MGSLEKGKDIQYDELYVCGLPLCLQTMGFLEQLLEYEDVIGRCLAGGSRCE